MTRCSFVKAKKLQLIDRRIPISQDCFSVGKPKFQVTDHLEIDGLSPDIAGLLAIIVGFILMKSLNQLN